MSKASAYAAAVAVAEAARPTPLQLKNPAGDVPLSATINEHGNLMFKVDGWYEFRRPEVLRLIAWLTDTFGDGEGA
jgi:hypothetical protein